MPGIVGVLGLGEPEECKRLVNRMLARMLHKDTYASGIRCFPALGAYVGWVAHENAPAPVWAVHREHEDVCLILAGESFPADDRNESPPATRQGNGNCGDRVLHGYVGDHKAFVSGLNGLFAGLLVEQHRNRAILFADRFGGERLYWCQHRERLLFASEAKALLDVLPEMRAFDDEGVAQFLAFGSTLNQRTLFRSIKVLPAGSLWIWAPELGVKMGTYFQPADWESQPLLGPSDYVANFTETFQRVLPRYLRWDGPVGISLTGGLDSRMIIAAVRPDAQRMVCYTYDGLEGQLLDTRLATRIAAVSGLDHHTLRIGADFLTDYGHFVDSTIFLSDGCAGASLAHELYLSRMARRLAAVRLTGNFGSEILRENSTFKPLRLSRKLIDEEFLRSVEAAEGSVAPAHPVTHAAFREMPWHLFGNVAVARSEMVFRTPYLDNEIVKLAYRAPQSIRRSPWAALQFVRATNPPLSSIPTDRGIIWGRPGIAGVARRAFCEATFKLDYLHREGLPGWLTPADGAIGALGAIGILGLHKFLPYRSWFRRELGPYISSVLRDSSTARMPYWNTSRLAGIADDHIRGRANNLREINAILTLEAVNRNLLQASIP